MYIKKIYLFSPNLELKKNMSHTIRFFPTFRRAAPLDYQWIEIWNVRNLTVVDKVTEIHGVKTDENFF